MSLQDINNNYASNVENNQLTRKIYRMTYVYCIP